MSRELRTSTDQKAGRFTSLQIGQALSETGAFVRPGNTKRALSRHRQQFHSRTGLSA
jgi:hypothetical protein